MASKRVITSDTWQDEFIGSLSFMQRLLWIGLFSRCADDQGRMIDNPVVIRSTVFPYDDVQITDIESSLAFFEGEGKIIRYSTDRKKIIQITNWWTHQRGQWAMPSKLPAPEGWNDEVRAFIKGEYIEVNWPKKTPKKVDAQDDQPPESEVDIVHLDNPPEQSTLTVGVAGHNHNLNHNLNHNNESSSGGGAPNVFTVYSSEIGAITPMIADKLKDAETTYSTEWVIEALQESARQNKRSWAYAEAILKRRLTEGTATVKSRANGSKTGKKTDTSLDDLIRSGK